MSLSAEDNLRLNVLLKQELHAVRIDESKMIVHALTAKGEAKIPLNPVGKDEAYVKEIKALLSTHVMGSPGGYPVFLKRWTRMGQARDESLAQMLLLGEPEAVVAAVHAQGLTDELAARAWWAMPTAENARRMLEKQAVVEGKTGPELAAFLLEFPPFEEEQLDMIESVRRVLQPGLISEEDKQKLWSKARTKRAFYVGFLHTCPDSLPMEAEAHAQYEPMKAPLSALAEAGNACAALLLKLLSPQGQAFVKTAQEALKKPANQDVVVSLLEAIANYFSSVRPARFQACDIEAICQQCAALCEQGGDFAPAGLRETIEAAPALRDKIAAMLILSCLSVQLVNPIFARTDAIGTVMRKKIKPVTDPIFAQLECLRH